ncbi:protein kinase C theta type-like [Mantella aurantiaca]
MKGSSIEGKNSCSSVSSNKTNEPIQPLLSKSSLKDKPHQLTMDSFIFHHLLGEGSYGKVLLASHTASKELLAVKIVKKRCLIENGVDEALIERQALEKTRHNMFITHLFGCFQTEECLFFAMDYLCGGDLQNLIDAKGLLSENTVRILTAEIVCGLQHIHSIGIVHRDIKPLNILLDSAGHAKIADFGLSAMGVFETAKITGCIHQSLPYDAMVDYYALGVSVYEMVVGEHPYYQPGMNLDELALEMITFDPCYPLWLDSDLLDLLCKLMGKDQEWRRRVLSDIRDHPFFRNINWVELENGEAPPLSFSGRHLELPSLNTVNVADILSSDDEDSPMSPEEQQHFMGFSFISEKLKVEIISPPSKPQTGMFIQNRPNLQAATESLLDLRESAPPRDTAAVQ